MGRYTHRVARHVEHDVRAVDSYAIDINFPQRRLAGSSIFGHGISHLDIKEGILQAATVQFHNTLV